MLEKLQFYIQHSLADLRANPLRTIFAIFCIATGVGVVVALQNLGVMIDDTLTSDLQKQNRGDIAITLNEMAFQEFDSEELVKTEDGYEVTSRFEGELAPQTSQGMNDGGITFYEFGGSGAGAGYMTALSKSFTTDLADWARENGYGEFESISSINGGLNFAEVFIGLAPGSIVTNLEAEATTSQQTAVYIDPQRYPFYDEIVTQDGKLLEDVLIRPNQIVLSQNTAGKLDAEVGDVLELNLLDGDFEVVGIVDNHTEIRNPFSADMFLGIFGYYYVSEAVLETYDLSNPDAAANIYIKLDDPSQAEAMADQLEQDFPYLRTSTPDDILEVNKEVAGNIDDILKAIGLMALLLGSIGIINTMQVIVSRRTLEIGVLKTIGMKGRQITTLFIIEAILLGLISSGIGVMLGIVATYGFQYFGENLLSQDLTFKIAFAPLFNGLIIGTVITVVFGFLPTLTASKVRPAIVLRPKDAVFPRSGILAILFTLILTVLVLALTVMNVMELPFLWSAGIVGAVFVGGAILFPILWILIWLVARLVPKLGFAELEIAKQQLRTTKSRSAVTLMALVIGVFSLSSIALFADAFISIIDELVVDFANGRPVLIQSLIPGNEAQIETILQESDDVESYTVVTEYDTRLVQIEHVNGDIVTAEELNELADTNYELVSDEQKAEWGDALYLVSSFDSLTAFEYDALEYSEDNISRGRGLNQSDIANPGIVLPEPYWIENASLQVGDQVTVALGESETAQQITFTVVGFLNETEEDSISSEADNYILADVVSAETTPQSVRFNVSIPEDEVGRLQREMQTAGIQNTFVFDLRIVSTVVNVIVNKFASFPYLFGFVGITVGAVVIANSVALSTLERRKDIAVLKAIGLKRQGVLLMILSENALLGLVGAIFGVGFGILAISIYDYFDDEIEIAINWWIAGGIAWLSLMISIGAAFAASWGTSGEKPLNVLRYE